MSLDLLGAGEGLGKYAITVRVKSIDPDRLAQKVGGAAKALPLVDQAPEIALRAALPWAAGMARNDYGVDLDWQIAKVPPGAGPLEKNDGLGLGVALGLGAAALGFALWKAAF